MTTLTKTLTLRPRAPVTFVLDRSASMATRDCPGGATRWAYALTALRAEVGALIDAGHPCTLLTCGVDVQVYEQIRPEQISDHLRWGDAACCLGQAFAEAAYFSPPAHGGAVIVIVDGIPDRDTRVGTLFTTHYDLVRMLLPNAYLLTVGEQNVSLQAFAAWFGKSARLEHMIEPPPAPVEERALTAREELEQSDTLPPPAAPRSSRSGRKR